MKRKTMHRVGFRKETDEGEMNRVCEGLLLSGRGGQ